MSIKKNCKNPGKNSEEFNKTKTQITIIIFIS